MDTTTEWILAGAAGVSSIYLLARVLLAKPKRFDEIGAIKLDNKGNIHVFGSSGKYLQYAVHDPETGKVLEEDTFRVDAHQRYFEKTPSLAERFRKIGKYHSRIREMEPWSGKKNPRNTLPELMD